MEGKQEVIFKIHMVHHSEPVEFYFIDAQQPCQQTAFGATWSRY